MHRDLAGSGVSVINVGGVAFSQFAALFGQDGLPIPCSIITDGDAAKEPPDPDSPDLTPNQQALNVAALAGGNVEVFLADVTLEWDLARAQPNDEVLTDTLTEVHSISGPEVAAMKDLTANAWAFQFRDKLTLKAEFAQRLAAALDDDRTKKLTVPKYLRQAIEHVTGSDPEEKKTSPTEQA